MEILPLRSDLADALRAHLANKLHTPRAFGIPKSDKTAETLRQDLADARSARISDAAGSAERARRGSSSFLPYRDQSGLVADFHALRHTLITNLANSGVHPKVAQILAQRSTITLIMDRCTQSMWEQLTDPLAKLPDLSRPTTEEARATGTMGKMMEPSERLALCLARKGTESNNSVQPGAVKPASTEKKEGHKNPEKARGKTAKASGWGGIRDGSVFPEKPPHFRARRRTIRRAPCSRTPGNGNRTP